MRFFSRRAAVGCAIIALVVAPAAAQTRPSEPSGPVKRLSVDDAVRLAFEQNLGIQIERLNPQIQDIAISQARSFWAPSFSSSLTNNSQNSPPTSIFSGAQTKV